MPAGALPTLDDVKQWDIWHVYWDHGDGTGKERTALAVSTRAENVANGYVKFLKITSQDHPDVPCRHQIDPRDATFRHTGLRTKSWIHLLDTQKVAEADLRYKHGSVSQLTAAWVLVQLRGLG